MMILLSTVFVFVIRGELSSCRTVINAVSLYEEKGDMTFERVHVKAAADLAAAVRDERVSRFIQTSGIGSDAEVTSPYISARGRGERAVRNAFPNAIVVRPAVMIGRDDAFLTRLVKMVRTLPLLPMFGNGGTRIQPAYVGEAVGRLRGDEAPVPGATTFEFGGPKIYTYRNLAGEIARRLRTGV